MENHFRSIRNELSELFSLVDAVNGENGVATHIAMTMLEVGNDRTNQGLQQFEFLEFGDETKSTSSNVLVGMFEVQTEVRAGKCGKKVRDSTTIHYNHTNIHTKKE
jgi:hypothetical protein